MRLAASYKLFLFTYLRKNRESEMLFFLYFFIFSCFSKARKAVKRTPKLSSLIPNWR